jgi:hypothetical protein
MVGSYVLSRAGDRLLLMEFETTFAVPEVLEKEAGWLEKYGTM